MVVGASVILDLGFDTFAQAYFRGIFEYGLELAGYGFRIAREDLSLSMDERGHNWHNGLRNVF